MRFRDPRKSESGIRAASVISSSTTFSSPRSAKSMTLCEQCLVVACKLDVQLSHANFIYKVIRLTFNSRTKILRNVILNTVYGPRRTKQRDSAGQRKASKDGRATNFCPNKLALEKWGRRSIDAALPHLHHVASHIHRVILSWRRAFMDSSSHQWLDSSRHPCLAPCIHRVNPASLHAFIALLVH